MQNKEQSHFAFMDSLSIENGFTLLTTLFMISLLSLTLPFLGYTLQSIQPSNTYNELSIHEFYRFIRDELASSTSFEIQDNKLHLNQELALNEKGEKIVRVAVISRYDQLVRRQVNNRGHEVFLYDISKITFQKHPYGLKISIIDLEGKTYEKSFVFYN